jgi:hypothetical protein
MPAPQSLDELIARKAAEFADQIRSAAAMADKEEEIRIECEKQLAFIQKEAGVKLEGRHEFTVASGRVDSVYQQVIIEYKNPGSAADRIGSKADAPGSRRVVDQIKRRFYDMRSQHGQPLNSLFGVGLDGNHFIFVRFRDDKWHVQDPVEVNRYSAERFLWALFNLGSKGKPFSAEYLSGDFGSSERSVATTGIPILYHAIAATEHPKAQTFFSQWKILFGEVCGFDVDDPSDKIKKLADSYGVPRKGLRPAELLFSVHSYYAIFMKLLASEIVAFFHRLPTPLQKIMQAPTSAKLRREMEDLESGSIFRHLNITNFLEGDLFAWYTSVWSDPVEKLVRDMVARLDNYAPGTLSEDPAGSRDLLKRLYQQLFPKSVRHDLGEYYTPDWLAEHVLNELGYVGDPDKRLLDPACGSGTFLVMAINRIRAWYDENRERCRFAEDDLCRKILANVIGFDLNPLAVMAARTNYLIAIRGLISHVERVEIPVYLCDSIMTPGEYGGLYAGKLGKARELETAAATFLVPTEIAASREKVAAYTEQLEFCIRNRYSPQEFLQRCQQEGLDVSSELLHFELFAELVRLDKANKNGVWARIIKNAFAPLFVGTVDYVVGNPPWVNWESLPVNYRDGTLAVWDRYRLRERVNVGARLGNVKKELSALFVYASADYFLKTGGKLGFVITQTIFKSGANEGFRRFAIDKEALSVRQVSDLSLLLPFENATNRTAVLTLVKGGRTHYPVQYRLWVPPPRHSPTEDVSLDTVQSQVKIRNWLAAPVEPSVHQSTWLTADKNVLPLLQQVIGDRMPTMMERTYAGSCTWLNGVFWLERLRSTARYSLVRNLGHVGRTKVEVVTARIEDEFLFPLLRGRDVKAWRAEPSAFILVPHRSDDFGQPISLGDIKMRYPLLLDFLGRFESKLRARSGYRQLHRSRPEFYVVGNVGNYTLATHKVVFKDLTEFFQCAVAGPSPTESSNSKTVIPDHTLLFITCDSASEAYFIAGLLNSVPARTALYCASVGVQTQRYFPTDVSRVKIPTFRPSDTDHREVIRLSKACHELAASGSSADSLNGVEHDLTRAAANIWSISGRQVRELVKFYGELCEFRQRRSNPEASEEGDE